MRRQQEGLQLEDQGMEMAKDLRNPRVTSLPTEMLMTFHLGSL
jgi:hypothetical protein